MLKLGELIRQKRREKGLTQAELAEKAGITDGYIARIEIGTKASFKTLTKTVHALGIKMSDIVKADDELVNTLNEVTNIYETYDKEFSAIHPTLKSLILKLAPVIQEYL